MVFAMFQRSTNQFGLDRRSSKAGGSFKGYVTQVHVAHPETFLQREYSLVGDQLGSALAATFPLRASSVIPGVVVRKMPMPTDTQIGIVSGNHHPRIPDRESIALPCNSGNDNDKSASAQELFSKAMGQGKKVTTDKEATETPDFWRLPIYVNVRARDREAAQLTPQLLLRDTLPLVRRCLLSGNTKDLPRILQKVLQVISSSEG